MDDRSDHRDGTGPTRDPAQASVHPGVASGAQPALRASDADRERVARQLQQAGADGRLDFDELEERLTAAYAVRTVDGFAPLLADLVPRSAGDSRPGTLPVDLEGLPQQRWGVARGGGGARWLVAIMSGVSRRGRWRIGRDCYSLNIMGGADLDLTEVELGDEVVNLTVFSFMGGAEIRLPEGLAVEVSDFGFMGGSDVNIGNAPHHPGQPLLRLNLISIMGGVDVKRGRKVTRRERREQSRIAKAEGRRELGDR